MICIKSDIWCQNIWQFWPYSYAFILGLPHGCLKGFKILQYPYFHVVTSKNVHKCHICAHSSVVNLPVFHFPVFANAYIIAHQIIKAELQQKSAHKKLKTQKSNRSRSSMMTQMINESTWRNYLYQSENKYLPKATTWNKILA